MSECFVYAGCLCWVGDGAGAFGEEGEDGLEEILVGGIGFCLLDAGWCGGLWLGGGYDGGEVGECVVDGLVVMGGLDGGEGFVFIVGDEADLMVE